MRLTLIVAFSLIANLTFCQGTEEEKVKNTIVQFFDAFHKQDSMALRSFAAESGVVLQSIGKNREGVTQLRNEDFDAFVKSISSIPKDTKFEEKLTDFKINIDGPMANAWTSYEFWVNGKFSHCGVNSFQLIKLKEDWKIIYLIDTRRREDCN